MEDSLDILILQGSVTVLMLVIVTFVEITTKGNIDRIAHLFFINYVLSGALRLLNAALIHSNPDYSDKD